jgi:hypothetical protein
MIDFVCELARARALLTIFQPVRAIPSCHMDSDDDDDDSPIDQNGTLRPVDSTISPEGSATNLSTNTPTESPMEIVSELPEPHQSQPPLKQE